MVYSKKTELKIIGIERISRSASAWHPCPLFARNVGERTMTAKKIVLALALLLGTVPAAMAQSAYTTGSVASNAAAGYPSPEGPGRQLYAYAPG
jgi:hypothetical protein